MNRKPKTILLAEDDPADRELIAKAIHTTGLNVRLETVSDGEALVEYLKQRLSGSSRGDGLPDLILVDLNMPRMGGVAAVREIKQNTALRRIPILVLTVSDEQKDIWESYDGGASAYLAKPTSFDRLVHMMEGIIAFWFDTARLPGDGRRY